jgi:CBS domain-containing protein
VGLISVRDALPHIFRRPLHTIESGDFIFVAGTLLDIPRRDVFAIAQVKGKDVRLFSRNHRFAGFSGYGLLLRLLRTDPKNYYKFLFQPCERASLLLPCVDADSDLARVFEVMLETRIGWCLARKTGEYAMVTLADLLSLYAEDRLATDLNLGDVASSPIFYMDAGARLDEAVRQMIKRRVRRVFLSGTREFVSDREVLMHIFSPDRLNLVKGFPERMLDSRIGDIGPARATRADAGLSVTKTAMAIDTDSGAHCVLTRKGLVTPWDLVMKPWAMGRLKMAEAVLPKWMGRGK